MQILRRFGVAFELAESVKGFVPEVNHKTTINRNDKPGELINLSYH
jgi:hypothetical protein